MKQQFIGLQHCKCGMSWKKDIGFFERTGDMVFALERKVVKKTKSTIKTKQVPIIRHRNDEPEVFYHYTCSYLLPTIIKSGYLTLTESNFSSEQMGLFPVVWLTSSPTPDNHGLLFAENMPDDLDKTHIRFTIRKRPYIKQWDEWSNNKGMDKQQKQILIATASAEATYKSWYISEQMIPIATDVICVENLKAGQIRKF